MWRKFLAQPWCRAVSAMIPTAICTQTHLRPNLTVEERVKDLASWQAAMNRPGFREGLWRLTAQAFGSALARIETEAAMKPRLTHPAQPATGV
jgi:hypothetical protein